MFRLFFIALIPITAFSESLGPDALAELAFENNPALAAAQARTEVADARVPQARALPDPELMYGYYAQSMGDRQELSVRQGFPYPGTLRLRGEVAGAAVEASTLTAENLRRSITANIHTVYADLAYVQASIALLEQNSQLFAQTESLIEARIEAGRAGSAELLRARIARARVDDEQTVLEARLPALAARLNALLGRPANTPLPDLQALGDYLTSVSPAPLPTSPGADNPELRALDRVAAGQRSAIELARKSGRPDFSVGLGWMDTGSGRQDDVKILFGLSLPIWRERYRAADREARAEVRATESERLDRQLALNAELTEALERHRDTQRRSHLYGEMLIPQARDVVAAEESAYSSGETDLLNLIEAQRVLLDLERVEQEALAEQVRTAAIIQRIAGNQ